ncbi:MULTISPECIES: ABC transporter permease [Brevibacterium]|uniref:FtsX-like permease family protein n=1 Tax=Brevibacterium sediminis TaxID=1857024 RepID=A0A5C4X073_9MICO|nr:MULTISPECIES: FtsX-like permease family protein [Brevibacterium]MCS4592436.1 ABC transporter permease [Brevibacterium sediminis]TNM53809.1 FtsX-like permease family protein [Brevibacterium sediminis]
MITGFAASIVEAWQELRVHKVRVLMSLIGVGVAVCALTLVVGFGNMMQKGLADSYEQQGGRAATYTLSLNPTESEMGESEVEKVRSALDETADRFGISHISAYGQAETTVPGPAGTVSASMYIVDPDFDVMRRLSVDHGRWFTAGDAANLSPAVVADETFLSEYGIDPTSLPATIELSGSPKKTATVIGSVPSSEFQEYGEIYVLNGQEKQFAADAYAVTEFEMWVPPEVGEELSKQVTSDLRRQLPGFDVSADRTDFASDIDETLGPVKNVLLVISILILFMGMLGLLNISLVTIQQRIREIGIRRSFGATSRRIFFSVMMESVVATTIAGAVGVLIAVLVLKAPLVSEFMFDGASTPQVPISAAIVGMLVSVGAGALAGSVPAVVATRVRIIDAIRA